MLRNRHLVYFTIVATSVLLLAACKPKSNNATLMPAPLPQLHNIAYRSDITFAHVFVALCDNKYQGIVPVPPKIGNGQDADNNLYWGGDYGVRTYFKKSREWKLVKSQKLNKTVLQRLVFKNLKHNCYLVADAYDGRYIKQATIDLLYSCAGRMKDTIHADHKTIGIDGNAKLLAYIGHDGLMDFRLPNMFSAADDDKRDCIILACISKSYFGPFVKSTNTYPLVWSTGLMCPEAYTLHDAVSAYLDGRSKEDIRMDAANAYNKYQKSGFAFAKTLLVSGW